MSDHSVPTSSEILAEIEKQGEGVPTNKPEPLSDLEDDPIETERELAFAKLRAFQDHHESKKRWSEFMIEVMAVIVAFQFFLLAMVGFGWWDFSTYDWLLPLLLVQNFAQVVGLALVVVKALFGNFKE